MSILAEFTLPESVAFLSNPFWWGLAVGLVLIFFVWQGKISAIRNLKKENKRVEKEVTELQSHLNTQLKINASGNQTLTQERDELKEQNENLRVNIATLQQKPEKTELRQLNITEAAVSKMREQAPGFATAWEQALRSAEDDYARAENGFARLFKKVSRRSPDKAVHALETDESNH